MRRLKTNNYSKSKANVQIQRFVFISGLISNASLLVHNESEVFNLKPNAAVESPTKIKTSEAFPPRMTISEPLLLPVANFK